MLEAFADNLTLAVDQSKSALWPTLQMLAALWAVSIGNWVLGKPLTPFGIIPRHIRGLLGIPIAPWVHGNMNHLFFNSLPLFMLGSFILAQGIDVFISVSLLIIALSGLLLWFFGRLGNHIGASGVVMGFWGYLLAQSLMQPGPEAFLVGFVSIYYFGSLATSLFPSGPGVSWEGHVFGCAAGILTAFLLV